MEKRVRQLSITADEMDRRQSAARRLNRNENNRLRRQHDQFRDNHGLVSIEIDQEMKKIQNELHCIREITGYEGTYVAAAAVGRSSGEESAAIINKSDGKRKRKQSQRTAAAAAARQRRSKDIETGRSARRRLTRDETLVGDKVKFHGHSMPLMVCGDNVSRDLTNNAPDHQNVSSSTRRVTRVAFSNMEEGRKLPQLAENVTSDSRSFIELDVDEARTQARKRILAGRETELIKGEAINQDNEESATTDDVESYMYVPPDGRKRTVYLVPPLEDLLKEARKARYLRMPKRLLAADEEDQERELSVDEIFSKQV